MKWIFYIKDLLRHEGVRKPELLEKLLIPLALRIGSEVNFNELANLLRVDRAFYDNGIRNALIGDFKFPELRNDIGQLWENFIISERQKRNSYGNWHGRSWFWHTYQQQEIDLIEEIDGSFSAFETKWTQYRKVKFPRTFTGNYQPVTTLAITPENFDDFLD